MAEKNIYLPYLMRIAQITDETPAVKTFRLEFMNEEDTQNFAFKTGQFGLYSAFGAGESTFCIASSPTRKGYIECTFQKVGRVTSALADKEVGDIVGFRGPYGNIFPIEEWKGKNLLFVAGGIALPPLRSVIWNCLDLRDWFQTITLVYGARRAEDLVYKQELQTWQARADIEVILTVYYGSGAPPGWQGQVGSLPHIVEQLAPQSDNTIAIVCGSPHTIGQTLPLLASRGFAPENIFTTLENRMKCGFGKCGRCNTGKSFVCKDGPVYTLAQLQELPAEY